MMKEIETEIIDWRTLPDDIDFLAGGWTYGRGGNGLNDDQWSISYTSHANTAGDLTVKCYVLPNFISGMINRAYDKGYMEAQKSIRTAIGV